MPRNWKLNTYICTQPRNTLTFQYVIGMSYVSLGFVLWGLFAPNELLAQENQPSLAQVTTAHPTSASRQLIVVTGAPGEEEYIGNFRNWSERWVKASQEANIDSEWIDGTQPLVEADSTEQTSDKKRLLDLISQASDRELWLVLIGHGTFDGKLAKFNLRGEDISATELATALSVGKGPQVIVHCFSCSGAFLPHLSRPERIVITATKSGAEMNYSRFGDYMSLAILDPAADLDHDNSVSILEAFLMAAKRTEQFYVDENRLATEHPLLEDGGDKKGVSASFFRGIRLVKQAGEGATIDGDLAAMTLLKSSDIDTNLDDPSVQKRNELELALRVLRLKKATLSADDYYTKLGEIAVELASLYDASADKTTDGESKGL